MASINHALPRVCMYPPLGVPMLHSFADTTPVSVHPLYPSLYISLSSYRKYSISRGCLLDRHVPGQNVHGHLYLHGLSAVMYTAVIFLTQTAGEQSQPWPCRSSYITCHHSLSVSYPQRALTLASKPFRLAVSPECCLR